MSNVITRFAPSPTGYFHVGSYRTALFAWIFAKQNKGKFILRIEDTDKERSKKEYEENIIESLKWLGLDYDGFYRQSDRTELYEKYVKQLLNSGHAYVSDETGREDNVNSSRKEVIRFNNPNKKVAFDDLIRGRIEFDTTELEDFVIAKSLAEPIFHLVNVIDDHEMEVTHIIRGEDHISNTPRQLLIYEALGFAPPVYAHIPLLLSSDRSKLSKRNGAVPITDYRRRGYLPEALVNYLALLGWHPKDDSELLSNDELIRQFSLDRVQKGGAIFNEEKLKWFNKQYIAKLTDAEFAEHAQAFLPEWLAAGSGTFKKLAPLLKSKIMTLGDIAPLFASGGELEFVRELAEYPAELLLWKKNPDVKSAMENLIKVRELLGAISEKDWNEESLRQAIMGYAEEKGRGDVLWPMRVALTGQEKSPDPFVSAVILGKDESLKRIENACKMLEK